MLTAPAKSMASATSTRVTRSSRRRSGPGPLTPWRSRTSPECRYTACGMTVAPSIAAASITLSVPSKRGMRPSAAAAGDGGSTTTLVRNPIAITANNPMMTRSNGRWPLRSCTSNSPIETSPVITPPTSNDRSNNRFNAMAPPTTSAKSVAIATSSACTQYPSRVEREERPRTASGNDMPVTTPNFADRYCTSPAITFAATMTHTSKYPNSAPALMFDATLPGST